MSRRITSLTISLVLTTGQASAADILEASCAKSGGTLNCTYKYTGNSAVSFLVQLPEGAIAASGDGCVVTPSAGRVGVSCERQPAAGKDSFSIRVDAKLAEKGTLEIEQVGVGEKPRLAGPIAISSPKLDLVTGYGLGVRTDDFVDFQPIAKDSTHIVLRNDSRARPDILVALKVCVTRCERVGQLGALLGVHFANGTSSAIDGITFAATRGIARQAFVYVGVAWSLGTEISPGFRIAAKEVQAKGAVGFTGRNLDRDSDFDGLPLKYKEGTAELPLFPASPIIESYNKRLTFGVAIPTSTIAKFFTPGK